MLVIDRYSFRALEIGDIIKLGDNVKLKSERASAATLNLLKLSHKTNNSFLVFTDENENTLSSSSQKLFNSK